MARPLIYSVKQGIYRHYYVREAYYDRSGMRQRHRGKATLMDLAAAGTAYQIMSVICWYARKCLPGDIERTRKDASGFDKVFNDLFERLCSINQLQVAFAHYYNLNVLSYVNGQWRDAFRQTISAHRVAQAPAIGLNVRPKNLKIGDVEPFEVRIGSRYRFALPKPLIPSQWRSGQSLEVRGKYAEDGKYVLEISSEDDPHFFQSDEASKAIVHTFTSKLYSVFWATEGSNSSSSLCRDKTTQNKTSKKH